VAPAPPTTAEGSEPGAPLGDLAIDGYPMQQPPCDGGFITIIASAVGEQATANGIEAVLEQYPGSNYLRTDQTCSSLNPSVNGQPIYVVFFGPFPFASDACAARADGTEGSYARQLSNDVPPTHQVDCPTA
jgi:serine/threonine-protein kinase